LKQFKEEIEGYEREFLEMKKKHGVSQLKEMMKIEEIKKVLQDIGERKKKV
jgi:hypothetical protein